MRGSSSGSSTRRCSSGSTWRRRPTGWTAIHHPFTAPIDELADDFHERPGEALSQAYDIVLNGSEIGGGSIRIHRSEMQQRVFDVIGLADEEAQSQFGFLLDAFAYGPPPHGGIALGIDRLCALLAGADSIRDVIAFPKTASGGDPLTGAPSPITPAQRAEAGVDATARGPRQRPLTQGDLRRECTADLGQSRIIGLRKSRRRGVLRSLPVVACIATARGLQSCTAHKATG